MRLFDLIKVFCFDEKCRVYILTEEEAQFEGDVSDIPYWLCELNLVESGGVGVEDGALYFIVAV